MQGAGPVGGPAEIYIIAYNSKRFWSFSRGWLLCMVFILYYLVGKNSAKYIIEGIFQPAFFMDYNFEIYINIK